MSYLDLTQSKDLSIPDFLTNLPKTNTQSPTILVWKHGLSQIPNAGLASIYQKMKATDWVAVIKVSWGEMLSPVIPVNQSVQLPDLG